MRYLHCTLWQVLPALRIVSEFVRGAFCILHHLDVSSDTSLTAKPIFLRLVQICIREITFRHSCHFVIKEIKYRILYYILMRC
ncbi:hypothetical protein PUN28_001160 [Cardiocondyla obscurior]|uniref:Secreted protein n=1 Tax=Cardiocondyla obscurior TaxID=286306 RepID=A0AAW2H441_9HYME